jgi:hypothetical protein
MNPYQSPQSPSTSPPGEGWEGVTWRLVAKIVAWSIVAGILGGTVVRWIILWAFTIALQ